MPVPARISIITLGVRDVARATTFYEALGWKRSSASQEGISFFLTRGVVLALFGYEELAEDARVPAGEPPAFRGVSCAINLESEAEVDRVLGEAQGTGASILKPAERVSWGGYSGYFADPDGNAWEVAFNPFFPFAEDGSLALPE